MSTRNDLHGNVPDDSEIALLLVDVINDLEFEGGDRLLAHAQEMVPRLVALKRRCKEAGVPSIYVNDNFGHWRSDFRRLVRHCQDDHVRGEGLAVALAPEEEDYFILKPKHSAFYATALELLLRHLGAKTSILTGLTGDNCVLFTAHDAYLRDYDLVVPCDCIASIDPAHNGAAIEYMQRVLKVDARPSDQIDLARFATKRASHRKTSRHKRSCER
ncbi:MAG: isochorismatase family cysteine hydrolase [Minicystis sp.]